MRLILKLLTKQLRRHWLRTLLTITALSAAVAMVIVVIGGHELAFTQGNLQAAQAKQVLGRFDLLVISGTDEDAQANSRRAGTAPPPAEISERLLAQLKGDSRVLEILPCCTAKVECCPPGPMFRTAMHRPGQMLNCQLAAVAGKNAPYKLTDGQWVDSIQVGQAVIDNHTAKRLGATVGDSFQLISQTGRHDVRIGGIMDSPFPIRRLQTIYVSPTTFENLTGETSHPNRLLIDLAGGVSPDDFSDQLAGDARRAGTPVHIESPDDFSEEAKRWAGFRRRHGKTGSFFPLLQNAEMNLAILAALFVIFNTCTMGVQERMRQWGLLRAVGMTRTGLLCLIAIEGFMLATLGWLIGLTAGYLLMQESLKQLTLQAGQNLSLHLSQWFTLGAFTAYGAVFLASALPAWAAVRRRPLDALTGTTKLRAVSGPRWMLPLGLVLIALCPLSTLGRFLSANWPGRTITPLCILASLVGFVLLLPTFILCLEGLFSRVAGAALGLDHRLLKKQLSVNLWRVVGCLVALTVGLGLFVTIQIWGRSMMIPFMVPERCPDAVITVFPEGVPDEKLTDIKKIYGITSAVPMILQHPAIANLPDGVKVGGTFSRDVIYIGTDVKALIGEGHGIMECSFLRGDPKRAFRLISQGRNCLITDSLYLKYPESYDVGNTIELDTVDPPRRRLTYKIAGVIKMKGWHLLTMSAQMRRGLSRVGGMVLTSATTAREDYPGSNYKTFWLNLIPGTDATKLEFPIVKILDPAAKLLIGNDANSADASARAAHQTIEKSKDQNAGTPALKPTRPNRNASAARQASPRKPGRAGQRRGKSLGDYKPQQSIESNVFCRITDTAAMTSAIRRRSEGIIQAMTFYPLLALGLASLAVVNTMILSVRARNWEAGILRSLGLTRSQMIRYILAEGILIGLLACVISLAFGLLASWTGIIETSRSMGVSPVYMIPWPMLSLGLAAACILCICAAVAPAVWAATRKPLQLLQEGRAAE